MRSLALDLLALAAQSGAPPPAGAVLPTVAAHGIADQVAVLGRDLLAAPHAERAAAEALAHLTAARAALGAIS